MGPLLRWGAVILLASLVLSLLPYLKTNPIVRTVIASILVVGGMWLERFVIVIPTLTNPRLPYQRGLYFPTWVEWSLMIGSFAAFFLLYVLFTKLFPIVSIWEVQEGREKALQEVQKRMKDYMPGAAEDGAQGP